MVKSYTENYNDCVAGMPIVECAMYKLLNEGLLGTIGKLGALGLGAYGLYNYGGDIGNWISQQGGGDPNSLLTKAGDAISSGHETAVNTIKGSGLGQMAGLGNKDDAWVSNRRDFYNTQYDNQIANVQNNTSLNPEQQQSRINQLNAERDQKTNWDNLRYELGDNRAKTTYDVSAEATTPSNVKNPVSTNVSNMANQVRESAPPPLPTAQPQTSPTAPAQTPAPTPAPTEPAQQPKAPTPVVDQTQQTVQQPKAPTPVVDQTQTPTQTKPVQPNASTSVANAATGVNKNSVDIGQTAKNAAITTGVHMGVGAAFRNGAQMFKPQPPQQPQQQQPQQTAQNQYGKHVG